MAVRGFYYIQLASCEQVLQQPNESSDVTVCREGQEGVQQQTACSAPTYASSHLDTRTGWPVKPLGRWGEEEEEEVDESTLLGSSGERGAAVWILGIPGPQRQDVCTGHAVLETHRGVGGCGCGGNVPTIVCQPGQHFQYTWRSRAVSDSSLCCPPTALFIFSAHYLTSTTSPKTF